MKKLKLTDWFSSVADKTSVTDGASLVSISALTAGLKGIMGDHEIIPVPCHGGNPQHAMGPSSITDYITQFFAESLGEPMPARCQGLIKTILGACPD